MRKCPYCDEEIRETALKCKHCGEWFDKTTDNRIDKEWIGQLCPDGACIGHIKATGKCSVCGLTVREAQLIESGHDNKIALQEITRTLTTTKIPIPTAIRSTVNKTGAWCPNCGNRNSYKDTGGIGCAFVVFIIVSMGLALIMIPFLPKTWHCRICNNQWRA